LYDVQGRVCDPIRLSGHRLKAAWAAAALPYLGHVRLRGQLGLGPVAQNADHGAHLLERPRRRVLDRLQGSQCAIGMGGCQGPPGLSLDGDGRDVVANRVVELASELVALAELGPLDVADPRLT